MKNAVACFGSIMLVFVVVLLQVKTEVDIQSVRSRAKASGRSAKSADELQRRRDRQGSTEDDGAVADSLSSDGGDTGGEGGYRRGHLPRVELPSNSVYRLTTTDHLGGLFDLKQFAGQVTLIVNTACK